jgi:tetratricopeptide (TPR) repeat protein
MMLHALRFAAALCAALLLTACSSSAPTLNALEERANESVQRGAKAFARGNWGQAENDYLQAWRIYESLADTERSAQTLLSLVRVLEQRGDIDTAQQLVNQLLQGSGALSMPTRITAHGRAAALALAKSQNQAAAEQLQNAQTLCQSTCSQAAALWVLRARWLLTQTDVANYQAAVSAANQAIAASSNNTSSAQAERANALRVKGQALLQLKDSAAAVSSLQEALQIDQQLGLNQRVVFDLDALQQAYALQGDNARATQYEGLKQRAQTALRELGGTPGKAP